MSPDQIRNSATVFPHHAGAWLFGSALIVVLCVTRLGLTRVDQAPAAVDRPLAVAPQPPLGSADWYAWISKAARRGYEPLASRISTPAGFDRVALAPRSFGNWLRHLPVRPAGAVVLGFDRRPSAVPGAADAVAVIELQPGHSQILGSVNMALRLRAEYLWFAGPAGQAAFSFTSGARFAWDDWSRGLRPRVSGRSVEWHPDGTASDDRPAYAAFMAALFKYSSVHSLVHDTHAVSDGTIEPGDLFIVTARPGRAMTVLDLAVGAGGEVRAVLGQGGTPACTFHVLRAPDGSAWFDLRRDGALRVPGVSGLSTRHLRRW